jgi:hypothetical protein
MFYFLNGADAIFEEYVVNTQTSCCWEAGWSNAQQRGQTCMSALEHMNCKGMHGRVLSNLN